MLVGIMLCSPMSGAMAILGSGVATAMAVALGINESAISAGLIGFNPALVAISVGGFFFVLDGWQVGLLTVTAAISGTQE